jgi:AcrR family transcriptional regulator
MNPPNLDDPRVIKTRRALREAFTRLILQQGYDSISIQDIASEAQTARITFYRHYRDKEELLNDCLNVLYEELVEKTEREIAGGAPTSHTPARVFFEHLRDQQALYRILFSRLGTQAVLDRMQQYMAAAALKQLPAFGAENRPAIPDEIIAQHLVSAQVGLGVWWLKNDKPYSVAYMTRVSMWLSLAGVQRALGVEDSILPSPLPESTS